MANAVIDGNSTRGVTCALNTDGKTVVRVKVNPANNSLKVGDGTTGSDNGKGYAIRDDNGQPVWMGVSSADGVTPIEIYADSSGNLLIQST